MSWRGLAKVCPFPPEASRATKRCKFTSQAPTCWEEPCPENCPAEMDGLPKRASCRAAENVEIRSPSRDRFSAKVFRASRAASVLSLVVTLHLTRSAHPALPHPSPMLTFRPSSFALHRPPAGRELCPFSLRRLTWVACGAVWTIPAGRVLVAPPRRFAVLQGITAAASFVDDAVGRKVSLTNLQRPAPMLTRLEAAYPR